MAEEYSGYAEAFFSFWPKLLIFGVEAPFDRCV